MSRLLIFLIFLPFIFSNLINTSIFKRMELEKNTQKQKDYLIKLLKYKIKTMQNVIRSLEDSQKKMNTKLQSSQDKIRGAEATLSNCQSSLNLREIQVEKCNSNVRSNTENIHVMERVCQHNLTNLQHSNIELKENLTLCMIENERNTKLIKEKEVYISSLQLTLDDRNAKIRSLEDSQKKMNTKLQSSQDKIRDVESTLSNCQSSLNLSENQIAECNSKVRSKNEKILDMERVCQHNLTNLQELKENLTLCMIEIEKGTKLKEKKEVVWGIAKPKPKEEYDNCPPFGNITGAKLISVPNQQPFSVPCTVASDNYVWSIIERRVDQNLNFNRGWQEYRDGFGNFNGEFFIGLEKVHLMTSSRPHKLLIRLAAEGEIRNASYSNFKIGSENEGYPITSLGTYSGDAGDGLGESLNQKFSTFDRDNDQVDDVNCAKDAKGGWWLTDCGQSNLNFNRYQSVVWNNLLDGPVSVEISIRPTDIDYN